MTAPDTTDPRTQPYSPPDIAEHLNAQGVADDPTFLDRVHAEQDDPHYSPDVQAKRIADAIAEGRTPEAFWPNGQVKRAEPLAPVVSEPETPVPASPPVTATPAATSATVDPQAATLTVIHPSGESETVPKPENWEERTWHAFLHMLHLRAA